MKKVRIADQAVCPIGFGTWTFGDKTQIRETEIQALRTGIEHGVEVIDTAEMYGNGASERAVAEAIAPYNREDLFIISKVLPENASKKKLVTSLDGSLRRLKTDYLDHYLLHWQGSVPLEETVEALEQERLKGKIKSWGVSNLDTAELNVVLQAKGGEQCTSNQVRYNLGDRGIEYDLRPFMRERKIPLIAYAPVAKGDKLGANFTENKLLNEIAANHQCDVFQLLLAWCIRDGETIAIPQSGNPQHVLANVKAAEIILTRDELEAIDQVYPKPTRKQSLALW
ncbi:aldo/keto reductase [Enterococcus sp. JM4C]|uniref:aldo/keto reductase n=1 Tax=Candidatus Enterococcus huntleyi TaxID=1857217 RepID=UPI00137B6742|nr:aldo/keto reductase [Enterococcus sp. JM4C]KAF1296772.1 aldo/keto reductase [Enterococcus sp. JM4C]